MRWLHYIGGFYTPAKFITEARRHGVARRVSPSMAHSMSYGDVVTLLSWRGGKPVAFAEFVITRITLQADIAQQVGERLAEEGKASVVDSGGLVVRECRSYSIEAVYVVDLPLEEIVDRAAEGAKERSVKLSFMIGGPLTEVFDPPKTLDPPPPFTRGFIKVAGEGQLTEDPQMVGIDGYSKRTRKPRLDVQLTLGI